MEYKLITEISRITEIMGVDPIISEAVKPPTGLISVLKKLVSNSSDETISKVITKTGIQSTDNAIDDIIVKLKNGENIGKKSLNLLLSQIDGNELSKILVKSKKYTKYLKDLNDRVEDINKFIGSEKVYLFGAHVFSQVLLNMGIKESSVISILDDDPLKHGLRLYGTRLTVDPTSVLKGQSGPKVIVDAGPYTEQIKNNIIKNINNTVVFYEHIDRN